MNREFNNPKWINNWICEPANPLELNYRFILATKGKKPLLCIGINPSTAMPNKLDPTLKSVQKIAINNGYDSFVMLNVYPQIATNPKNLHQEIDKKLKIENMKAMNWIIQNLPINDICLACGNLIQTRSYLKDCLIGLIDTAKDKNWFAISFNKSGHPRHPLYLPENTKIINFNVNEYLNLLKKA